MTSTSFLIACLLAAPVALPAFASVHEGPPPADLFDFWVGDWDGTWKKADGTPGQARNRVSKILDGRVIEEQFETIGTGPRLNGRSLSVLHKGSQLWKQTWIDNQGGYYVFTGKVDGDKRIFMTDFVSRGGNEVAQRMVFHHIQKDSFTWNWEGTQDGGKTWKLMWQIEYKRRSAADADGKRS